jgi:diguanylate cyclase (GGDEF)-like protein
VYYFQYPERYSVSHIRSSNKENHVLYAAGPLLQKVVKKSSTTNIQNVGGTVVNAISEEHLKDLLTTETWRDQFITLSDSLGFSLSIYAPDGTLIFAPMNTPPFCQGFCLSSSSFKAQCESFCHPIMMNAISKGKPEVFKCYSKIMCFAFPIEYMDEHAVVVGHGSFSSYEDFRECLNILESEGLDTISITAPITFTSVQHTWKVMGFVADSVSRLLNSSRETIALRSKIESLKSIIGKWGVSAEDRPETLYKEMIDKLSSLLDIESIAILVIDHTQKIFISLYSLSRSSGTTEAITLKENDTIVEDLSGGKPFVLSAQSIKDPRAELLNGMGALYYFPVMVFKKLEGILQITDRLLKESDKQIISAYCQQTALSIENQRLHQDLDKKFDRFAEVSELTKTITHIRNYETLLQTILDKSADLLKAEQGSLMLLDHETDDLLVEAKKGNIERVMEKLRINRGEGIAGRVAEFGEAILVENLENDPRVNHKNRQHYKTRSFVSVPIKIDDRIIGVLNLSDKTSGEVFNEEDLKLIQSFATHAAIVMERNVFYNKAEELKKLTITDSLTGLLNRRYLNERLKDEVSRSERYGHHLSLLMLDLDGFKYCNDTLGHLFGDKALKDIAETLLNTVRSMDIVARYGGDEFMVILPETEETLAIDIAERLRSNVEKNAVLPRNAAGKGPQMLTSSIGIACYPGHGKTIELLLENVDKALYRAKNKGKNRIEVFS